jgi:hypothetical protein
MPRRKSHATSTKGTSNRIFFSLPAVPSEEAIEAGEISEEELDELDEKLEIDHQIGEDIRQKVCSI